MAIAKNVNIGSRATKKLLNVCPYPQCSAHDHSMVRGNRPLLHLQTGWCRAGYRMMALTATILTVGAGMMAISRAVVTGMTMVRIII